MSFIPRPQEIYRHFKGGFYQVMAVAEHTETGEQLVIYQALYGGFKIYARPLSLFAGRVDRTKYPDAAQELRFQLQDPGDGGARPGDAAGQNGDMAGQNGDMAGQNGDAAGQNRDAVGQNDAAGQNRDAAEQNGDAAGQNGDAAGQNGDAAGQNRDAAEQAGGAVAGQKRASSEAEGEVPELDPFLLEFLDSDSYEQRLNILAGLRHRITDEMITTMAVACDIEIGAGALEERYAALKTCLLTLERYECNRLR